MNKLQSILIIAISVLVSCDQNEAFFESINSDPVLNITLGEKSGILISDSLKTSEATAVFIKEVSLAYSDENANIRRIEISSVTDDVFVIQDDTILIGENFVLQSFTEDSLKLELLSFTNGFKQLDFTAIDDFGNETRATLELWVFTNLIPIVEYTVNYNEESNLVNFDLTKSFDQDSLYGGYIVEYELNFNGETLNKTVGDFTVLTSSTQSIYDYSLRVKDNSGEYSFIVSDRINL